MNSKVLGDLLRDAACQGVTRLHLVAAKPFWDEASLPFRVHGGGTVLRIVAQPGFTRDNLAGSPDERLLIVDCPDGEGWLAPQDVVAGWLARHVTCPALDDVLLAHPLYSHTTKVDGRGHSRMGAGRLAHWSPGSATLAALAEPPFRPSDKRAPAVNRDRDAYANAVVDLVKKLQDAFDLIEVEVAVAFV